MGREDQRIDRTEPMTLEAVDSQRRGLRVSFFWQRDRYAHRVAVLADGQALAWLASVEGTDQDPWPPSPPMQQLSIETASDGSRIAFLVGMAGASHWSASIEAQTSPPQIVFDMACRLHQNPPQLGSGYQLLASSVTTDSPVPALFQLGDHRLRLQIVAAGDQPPVKLQIGPSGVGIVPHGQPPARPATVRWKYRLSLFES